MAIDSRQKRRSIMAMGLPWRSVSLPIPDGTIGQADRQMLLYGYAGILWGEPSVANDTYFTYSSANKRWEFYVDSVKVLEIYNDKVEINVDLNLASSKVYKVNSTQVLGSQQAHIADADGTLADITTKFNTLLGQLETHGINADS